MSATLNDPPTWAVEFQGAAPTGNYEPASLGQPGAAPVGGVPEAPGGTVQEPMVFRYSDRGWIGEPDDADRPNVLFSPRLAEPPRIERSIRLMPEETGRATYQAGEISLLNDDGALDFLAGDWSLAGRGATLYRLPTRSPLAAPFVAGRRVAEMRITSAGVSGANRLTLALREAATDLNVPLAPVFAGTGGLEGDASLAGQDRPYLAGFMANIEPTGLLAAQGVVTVHSGPLASISQVRDRGVPVFSAGNFPTLAALLAASIPSGYCGTCLAQGLIRLESPPQGGYITCDAQAAGATSHAAIFDALLRGPGGLSADRIGANTLGQGAALPALSGLAGWRWTGGTVADALDAVVRSAVGWWGSDREGRIVAQQLLPPEAMTPVAHIEPWMLDGEPEEEAAEPPRWRARVGYRPVGKVQALNELAGQIQADAVRVRWYGQPYSSVEPLITDAVRAGTLAAVDPAVLVSAFAEPAGAQALQVLLEQMGAPRRRRFRVPVGKYGALAEPGQVVTIGHRRLAGRPWLIGESSEQGDDIRWAVRG